jgi:putative translation initiation factor aIF-2 beta subunit
MEKEAYEKMLAEVRKKIQSERAVGRFKLPEIKSIQQGNKTIIKNFTAIAKGMRRKPGHLHKFFLRELATPGTFDKMAVFIGKFSKRYLQEKLQLYAKRYVICPVCKKPDTVLLSINRIEKLKCEACGSISDAG